MPGIGLSKSMIFLDMEQRWLSLAHSYEFTERLLNFTDQPRE